VFPSVPKEEFIKKAPHKKPEKVRKKPDFLSKTGLFMELLGRFELPTSSLPIMNTFIVACYILLYFAEF